MIVLLLVFAGCSPKRVTSPATHSTPSTVKKKLTRTNPPPVQNQQAARETTPPGDEDLPAPESRPRSGRSGYRTSPESVTLGLQAANLAREQMGKQYQWGASGPDKFDCSGLTYFVFQQLGVSLPRVSRDQASVGQKIGRSELQPGDLVFFNTEGSTINHVGIYLENGEFVHAPRRYNPVRVDSLNDSWWRQRFRLARRLP